MGENMSTISQLYFPPQFTFSDKAIQKSKEKPNSIVRIAQSDNVGDICDVPTLRNVIREKHQYELLNDVRTIVNDVNCRQHLV
jgi:hypothetical protein